MIDRASITNWRVEHPWTRNSFVEQDLVICRALVSIYSDPFLSGALAFIFARGSYRELTHSFSSTQSKESCHEKRPDHEEAGQRAC